MKYSEKRIYLRRMLSKYREAFPVEDTIANFVSALSYDDVDNWIDKIHSAQSRNLLDW